MFRYSSYTLPLSSHGIESQNEEPSPIWFHSRIRLGGESPKDVLNR